MEEKLESYRIRKRKTEKILFLKNTLKRFTSLMNFGTTSTNESSGHVIDISETPILKTDETKVSAEHNSDNENENQKSKHIEKDWLTYLTWIIYIAIWITLFFIALELQFGGVYFIISCFVGIYINLREKPKTSREISAYSVFNRNCQSIDGTFNAEIFERQLGVRKL